MMHGKIHRATVTGAFLDYEGSIALDPDLYEAAGLLPYEQVHVLDVDNGNRFVTYVIEGERGSGEVAVNGAAARLVQVGDRVIILAYTEMKADRAKSLRPKVVLVDASNRPLTTHPNGRARIGGARGEGLTSPGRQGGARGERPLVSRPQGEALGEGQPSPR